MINKGYWITIALLVGVSLWFLIIAPVTRIIAYSR